MSEPTRKAFAEMYTFLEQLLDSSWLDESIEAKDCLEVFDEYDWQMKPGCDKDAFQQLKEKGNAGKMSSEKLAEFIDMVSRDGQYHMYLTIHEARKAITKYHHLFSSESQASPVEEYTVVAMSTAHLTKEDCNALIGAVGDSDKMVLKRPEGFFVKLFEEESPSNYSCVASETAKSIIRWAHQCGYRMIEFDCDAQVFAQFPVFDVE